MVRRKKSAVQHQHDNGAAAASTLSSTTVRRKTSTTVGAPGTRKRSTLTTTETTVRKISLQTDTVTPWGVVLKPVPMEQRVRRRSVVDEELELGEIEMPELDETTTELGKYKRKEGETMKIDVSRKKRSTKVDDVASSHRGDDDDDSKESSDHPQPLTTTTYSKAKEVINSKERKAPSPPSPPPQRDGDVEGDGILSGVLKVSFLPPRPRRRERVARGGGDEQGHARVPNHDRKQHYCLSLSLINSLFPFKVVPPALRCCMKFIIRFLTLLRHHLSFAP